jgi:ATP-binding cassette subfamily C protein CydCD
VLTAIVGLYRSSARVAPLVELLTTRPALAGGSDARAAVLTLPARVEFTGVEYRYPGARRPAVRAVSFAWEPGELLVLAGPNGSGKSTVLKLLLGIATAERGQVCVGSTSIAAIAPEAWRSKLAYLPQKPYLPARATVREAMRFVAGDQADGAMEAALAEVALLDDLGGRPEAPLDVPVGTLSAGQRQRLALARVLLREAPILLLDEPDANLDAAGIERVAEVAMRQRSSRMVAIVAHTPGILARADRVVRLDGSGQLTEGA